MQKAKRDSPKFDSIKRIAICFGIASVIFLLELLVVYQYQPLEQAVYIWLVSNLGPILVLDTPHWGLGLLKMVLCLGMALPAALRKDGWRMSLGTGGFVLWIHIGFDAIIQTI